MLEKNIDSNQFCKPQDKQDILIQGTRTAHAQKLLCNTLNGTMSAPEDMQRIQKLIDVIETRPSNDTIERFWIGWIDEEQNGTFVNIDSGSQLDNSLEDWYPGEPNGGSLENCVVVKTTTGRMHDFPCDVKYHGFCLMDRRPRVKVRGEIPSHFDTKFTLATDEIADYNTFYGYTNAKIYHDSDINMWKLESLYNKSEFATCDFKDYPIGVKTWKPYGSSRENITLNLNGCSDFSEATCDDGSCINIHKRLGKVEFTRIQGKALFFQVQSSRRLCGRF